MRNRAWLRAVLLLVVVFGAGACRKYVTHPIYRRPIISSVVAFPTTLGPGDSTMITITAHDPDGDALAYIWEPYNGLDIKNGNSDHFYYTHSPSMVFYRSPTWPSPSPYDTAFVWCSASDERGGWISRQVLIFYRD